MKGFDDIKFTQIAIWAPDSKACMLNSEIMFPQSRPLWDDLKMDGSLNGDVKGFPLSLSYIFGMVEGLELEYIDPSCNHWLEERMKLGRAFISHFGAYCSIDTMNDCISEAKSRGIKILQKTISHSHTNERKGGDTREYFDVVFYTESALGYNVKLTAKADGKGLEVLR